MAITVNYFVVSKYFSVKTRYHPWPTVVSLLYTDYSLRDVARHGLGGAQAPPNEKLAPPNKV